MKRRMSAGLIWLLTLSLILPLFLLGGCEEQWKKYSRDYSGSFDITASLIAFSPRKDSFEYAADAVGDVIERDGRLFDIYNSYDGLNNIKTINDNAGIEPVAVDGAIIELLVFAVSAYEITDGTVNAAMGSVLGVWHDYRERGHADEESASLPPLDLLREKSRHTDISGLIIDRQAGTVFLQDPNMSLDVGAIAKGFTAQRAMRAAKEAGLESFLINMGGNVVSCGKPMDGRERWSVGIQDPNRQSGGKDILDTVYVNDTAIVSSGDYQRFYTVNGVRYHHIIDPRTLMPADRFTHVTVLHSDSGMADMLSTALFLLSVQDGRDLLEETGAEAMWVGKDGSIETTEGFAAVSQKLGAKP